MSELLQQYYARLSKEGILKAVVLAMLIGFSTLLVSSVTFLIAGIKPFWICIIIWAVVVAAATVILYYKKFRPDRKAIAKRIDELGLEERILTMNQLADDDSYMARRQREDAVKALSAVNPKLIKIAVSVPLIVATSICAVFATGATTYTGLSEYGIVKNFEEIKEVLAEDIYYEVCYEVEGGGFIDGEPFQLILEGEAASPVIPMAEEGWAFSGWSDGYEEFFREDIDVREDMLIIAIFTEVEMEEGEGGGGGGEEGDESQEASGGGGGGGGGEDQSEGEGEGSGQGQGGGAGGQWMENNAVIDGETDYGDNVYDEAYESEMEDATNDGDVSDDLRDIIKDYFDTIKK